MLVTLTFQLPDDTPGEQLADVLHVARQAGERGRNWVDAASWVVTVFDGSRVRDVAVDMAAARG